MIFKLIQAGIDAKEVSLPFLIVSVLLKLFFECTYIRTNSHWNYPHSETDKSNASMLLEQK